MEDRHLTRALAILNRSTQTLQSDIQSHRELAKKTQHFIDRYIDLFTRKKAVEFKELYFANKFIKEIQSNLTVALEKSEFIEESCDNIERRFETFSAMQMLASFNMFEDDVIRKRLVSRAVEVLQSQKVDIKSFNIR